MEQQEGFTPGGARQAFALLGIKVFSLYKRALGGLPSVEWLPSVKHFEAHGLIGPKVCHSEVLPSVLPWNRCWPLAGHLQGGNG